MVKRPTSNEPRLRIPLDLGRFTLASSSLLPLLSVAITNSGGLFTVFWTNQDTGLSLHSRLYVSLYSMSQTPFGNIKGLAASELRDLSRLFQRNVGKDEIVSLDLAREMYDLAERLQRRLAVLLNRQGRVEEVVVGTKEIIYLPDLGRYRLGAGRLRNLRLVFTDLAKKHEVPVIPFDIFADLEKLRLDAVVALRPAKNRMMITYAHLIPTLDSDEAGSKSDFVPDLARFDLDFAEFISNIETELAAATPEFGKNGEEGAILVGVYESGGVDPTSSILELRELARTANVRIVDEVIQRRRIDPRTFMGKGKLEEVVLKALRRGAGMLIFDAELKPSQWRAITNSTELKVIDRSMLILDIFAQRARSSEGRLQVELAQLRYNLPRLVEKDAGLSRLSGGIGGRGPGETKLEIGRRRTRERISEIESRIEKVRSARGLRRERRRENETKLIAVIGYTNVGKSTLFNALTGASVTAENKLFATLDPSQRRLFLPGVAENQSPADQIVVLSDTVGFIRLLPKELEAAFKATLEELYDAALFMHVIDASDKEAVEKYNAVRGILNSMDLSTTPEIIVANKIDSADHLALSRIEKELDTVAVSATKKIGFDRLLERIALSLPDKR